MRHGDKVKNLGRKREHRQALLKNLTCQLIEHKGITTTLAKAKALRIYAEPLINRAKKDDTNNRRVVFSYLQNKEAIKELFGVIGDKISARPGGYTRIIKLPRRMGDAADMAYIELVDFNEIYNLKEGAGAEKKKTRRGRSKATTTTKSAHMAAATVLEETNVEEAKADESPAAELTDSAAPAGDDLALIEGIGPKVAEIFNEAGIHTFAQLSAKTKEELEAILDPQGAVYKAMDPTTWPQQAQMAADGKMEELKAWQDELKGGK